MKLNEKSLSTLMFYTALIFMITYFAALGYTQIGYDYPSHIQSAEIILSSGLLRLLSHNPYPLWHILVAAFYTISGFQIQYCSAIITAGLNAICYICVYHFIKQPNDQNIMWTSFLACSLLLVGPLWFPWVHNGLILWTPNPWHSPTNMIIRPIAVIGFTLIVSMLSDYEKGNPPKAKSYIFLAITMVISNIAKPSFAQIIIPGLGIYLLYMLIVSKGKDISFCVKLVLSFVPCVLITLIQFLLSFYISSYGSSGVGISWFEVMLHSLHHYHNLALLYLFPLFVLLTHIGSFKKVEVKLVVFTWLSSFLEAALLYEKGTRKYDGNFTWGLILATFLLYIVTVKILMSDRTETKAFTKYRNITSSIGWFIFFIQLCIGIQYVISVSIPVIAPTGKLFY